MRQPLIVIVLELLVASLVACSTPGPTTPDTPPAAAAQTTPPAAAVHPLEPLSEAEINATTALVRSAPSFPVGAAFAQVSLHEPPKSWRLDGQVEGGVAREAVAVVFDRAANATYEVVVDLTAGRVVRFAPVPGVQPMMLVSEFTDIPPVVLANDEVRAALARRGIQDPDGVRVDLWAPGSTSETGVPPGARFTRALLFDGRGTTIGYGRPIEGIVVVVDLNRRVVVHVHDTGVVPPPTSTHDVTDPRVIGTPRTAPRPLVTSQPEGPSFTLDGHAVRWQNWQFRFANDAREGLVLSQIAYRDGERVRPIAYRASVAEMVVPYGDPSEGWRWRAAFDQGEYGLGQSSNPLVAGLDVPEHATLVDTVLADNEGKPFTIPGSVAIWERDGGILWKHLHDFEKGIAETRRARELVIGTIVTIGNYDYSLHWVFTQDAQVRVEVELTGMLLTKGTAEVTCTRCAAGAGAAAVGDERYATLVAEHLLAPNHQHFFCFRLDLDVDGTANTVSETSVHAAPADPARADARSDNAFAQDETVIASERTAARDLDFASHRRWKISGGHAGALGHLPSYVLQPGGNGVAYLAADAPVRRKAAFIDHQVWVTRYHENERFAAGDYPNQSTAQAGLPQYEANDESLAGEDTVVWYTLGVTHVPAPEEWPIMSVARTGFSLVPHGFFERNPALDVPKPN